MLLCEKNPESGRSMIELMGVLALTALMTAGAVVLMNSGTATRKRAEITEKVAEIVTGVRTLYADYIKFPSDFDGASTLAALSIDTRGPDGSGFSVSKVDDNSFKVDVVGLTNRDCDILAAKAWTGGAASCPNSGTTLTIVYPK